MVVVAGRVSTAGTLYFFRVDVLGRTAPRTNVDITRMHVWVGLVGKVWLGGSGGGSTPPGGTNPQDGPSEKTRPCAMRPIRARTQGGRAKM